jgi:hypothetical protein
VDGIIAPNGSHVKRFEKKVRKVSKVKYE